MKIIIIEDEHLMAEELESLILDYDSKNDILAKLTTVSEAIDFLKTNPMPDLFFTDIQLPDGLSFEIFQEIPCDAPIIFCTAYDEYALQAFKANGIDYILKPFDDNAIGEALDKVKRITRQNQNTTDDFLRVITALTNKQDTASKNNILIHKGEKIIPLNASKIALVHIDSGATHVYTFNSEKFVAEQSLGTMETNLGDNFYRINRQFLINRDAIDHVSKYFARKLLVIPKFSIEEQIIVSKAKASHFLKWLQD